MEFPLQSLCFVVIGNLKFEKAPVTVKALGVIAGRRIVGEQVPVGNVARRAAGRLEQLFSMDRVLGNAAACRGRVVEQVPLDHVEVAFGDFLAVTVAIRIILANSRWSLDASAILKRFGNELPRAGVGNKTE